MRADWFYQPCQRCGNPQAGDRARTLASGRLVCGTCYERELPLDSRFCVIDDQVTRTWPETLELRKQLSTHVDK